jgi:Cu2+-containing amine oxidase
MVVENEVGDAGDSRIPTNCGTPAKSLNKMLNGQSTDGANIVVWYANRFLHHPRDEDDPRMPIEWSGFEIAPRSFHHEIPVGPVPTEPGVPGPQPPPVPLGDE